MTRRGMAILVLCCAIGFAQEMDAVKQIADFEKRSDAALAAAAKSLDVAREAMGKSDVAGVKKHLGDCAGFAELSLESLVAMGKPPYKNTKNYKKVELKTRELLRRIDTLLKDASIDDREALNEAHSRVNAVHEKVLEGVMSKKS